MKKIFTLVAMAMMAVGANAQTLIAEKDWSGVADDALPPRVALTVLRSPLTRRLVSSGSPRLTSWKVLTLRLTRTTRLL